jgi:cell division protein FtsB
MDKKNKRLPWIRWVLLALALLSLYHILTGRNGLFKLAQLRREQRMAQSRIDSLTIRKHELEAKKQRLLNDSAYLEKLARQETGMAKPGEKVYRFVAPPSGRQEPAKAK